MNILNKLKNEMKIVKWPNKKTVKKDFAISIVVSFLFIICLSFINVISNLLLSVIL